MEPGRTPVAACPLRLRALQPHAGAVGVEVHGVVGAYQRVDVGAGEELRRGLRTFGDRDLPAAPDAWLFVDGRPRRAVVEWSWIGPCAQHVAGAQRPAAVTAERAQRECRCPAEELGPL